MSKSKNPYPYEMTGEYQMWDGHLCPVRISYVNGWYQLRRQPMDYQIDRSLRWYELDNYIMSGIVRVDLYPSELNDTPLHAADLNEIL